MMLIDQICAQARVMGREMAEENPSLLEAVCASAASALRFRLRDNVRAEDCKSDFVTAAALFALAVMQEVGSFAQLEQVSAGDLTLRRGKSAAADSLRQQAELLMKPYLKESFLFLGV